MTTLGVGGSLERDGCIYGFDGDGGLMGVYISSSALGCVYLIYTAFSMSIMPP